MPVFLTALAVTVLYAGLLGWGWRKARRQEAAVAGGEDDPQDLPPVSVVVAVRDEEAALPDLLDALAAQTHPEIEIVLVDDASADATAEIAAGWCAERENARLVRVTDPVQPRKKRALTRGIEAARHALLAFTDADCTPPPEWAERLARLHAGSEDAVVLAGYSPMRPAPETGRVLGAFARYETLTAGLYTAAAAGWNRPYMAVGRNLSYPRSVFTAAGGFSDSLDSLSGDDDLFVQAVHRTGAARVLAVTDPRTFVPTEAPASWRAWWTQKRRHVSAGRSYRWTAGLHLTLLHGSLALLWLAPLFYGLTGAGLLATALLARHAALAPAADALGEAPLLAGFPLWELGYTLYHVLLVPVGLASAPDEWG